MNLKKGQYSSDKKLWCIEGARVQTEFGDTIFYADLSGSLGLFKKKINGALYFSNRQVSIIWAILLNLYIQGFL